MLKVDVQLRDRRLGLDELQIDGGLGLMCRHAPRTLDTGATVPSSLVTPAVGGNTGSAKMDPHELKQTLDGFLSRLSRKEGAAALQQEEDGLTPP